MDLSRGTMGFSGRKEEQHRKEGLEAGWASPDVRRKVLWSHDTTWMVAASCRVDGFTWSSMRGVVLTTGLFLSQTCFSQPGGPPSSRTETPTKAILPGFQSWNEPVKEPSPVQSHGQTGPTLTLWLLFTCGSHQLTKLEQVRLQEQKGLDSELYRFLLPFTTKIQDQS